MHLRQAKDRSFVAMAHGASSRAHVAGACARAGFVPRVTVEGSDPFVVESMVGAGLGVSVVPGRMADHHHPLVVRIPPSVCWALGPAPMRDVAQLVCDVLRACTEYWDSVFRHDSVHPSAQYRPHRVTDITELDGWEYTHYPNGDYLVFVSKDLPFGIVGNHHEKSLCFFGEPAVAAVTDLNRGILGPPLRRDSLATGSATEQ